MKAQWKKFGGVIDALQLRERALLFATVAALLLVSIHEIWLGPQLAKYGQLAEQHQQAQQQIGIIQAEIERQGRAHESGAQNPRQEHLQTLQQQIAQLAAGMHETQKRIVAPEKMTELLQGILKRNGKLQLISMRNTPSTWFDPNNLNNAAKDTAQSLPADPPENMQATQTQVLPGAAQPTTGGIYRHGVEIVVQGEYLEMIRYLEALETLPWQLFWGKATLNAEASPQARLTLVLYTLNPDKKWLDI